MTLGDAVEHLLRQRGPQTGAVLHEALGGEVFGLWKACRTPGRFDLRVIGRRYVRLDRAVPDFARLSPSVLREFMTYTVVGLPGRSEENDRAARLLQARIRAISRDKLRTAQRIADEVAGPLLDGQPDEAASFCILVAGDIVYDMSHDVVRHEVSTGGVVKGSDLDLVVLVADDAPESLGHALDEALHKRKWFYLRNPAFHEEIDYIVKRFARLVEQADFDTFPKMVACKVFDEARFLRGSASLHEAGRLMLSERGVLARLRHLEELAAATRSAREEYLLSLPGDVLPSSGHQQFYTEDERAEFEH